MPVQAATICEVNQFRELIQLKKWHVKQKRKIKPPRNRREKRIQRKKTPKQIKQRMQEGKEEKKKEKTLKIHNKKVE